MFIPGCRAVFLDLKKYLEAQFGESATDVRRWTVPLPRGTLLVVGDKVLIASPGRLTVLSRAEGKHLGQVDLASREVPLHDGLAAAEGQLLVTAAGEVICLAH